MMTYFGNYFLLTLGYIVLKMFNWEGVLGEWFKNKQMHN